MCVRSSCMDFPGGHTPLRTPRKVQGTAPSRTIDVPVRPCCRRPCRQYVQPPNDALQNLRETTTERASAVDFVRDHLDEPWGPCFDSAAHQYVKSAGST